MTTKPAAWLEPGDRIDLHGHQQTVTHTRLHRMSKFLVFTDYTGNDPDQAWLLTSCDRVTILPSNDTE